MFTTVSSGFFGCAEGRGGGDGDLLSPSSVLLARKKMTAPNAISPTIHIGLFMALFSGSGGGAREWRAPLVINGAYPTPYRALQEV